MPRKKRSQRRSFQIEHLEARRVLTNGPLVVSVELGSSDWPAEEFTFLQDQDLGTRGVRLSGTNPNLNGYSNLNQVVVNFDIPVVATQESLTLFGVESGELTPSQFEQFDDDRVAVWTFDTGFVRDNYLIDLDGDSASPIQNTDGDPLDGDFLPGGQPFPSGDGIDGGDFEFTFQVLPGLADPVDDVISLGDFRILKDSFGDSGPGLPADFNANGNVGLEDFRVLKDSFGSDAITDPHFRIFLKESQAFLQSALIPVELGQSDGSRTISLSLDAQFDLLDSTSSTSDAILLSLIDPDTGNELLSSGLPGTALFTLTEDGSEFDSGLVSFEDNTLEIDVSSLPELTRANLLVQSVNLDTDDCSSVVVQLLSNQVDPEGAANAQAASLFLVPSEPGPAINLAGLATTNTVVPVLKNLSVNETTKSLSATLQLRNDGATAIGRSNVVVFKGLPATASIPEASGITPSGDPYVNMTDSISRGGLASGATASRVNLLIENPSDVALPISLEVLTGPPNQGPTFDPITPVSLMPGQVEQFQFTASDSDGDPITFSFANASDLPGATLTTSGFLLLAPRPEHIGSYSIDIEAFDGALTSIQTLNVDVVADPVATSRISGIIEDIDEQPLVGVPIELGGVEVLTAGDGSFTIEFPGAFPDDTLIIHGEEIAGPLSYPFIAEKLHLLLGRQAIDNVDNQIIRPIYLPPLDVANGTPIDPNVDVTVTTATLPDVEVFVAAGTLMDQQGDPFSGVLSITEVPRDLTPAALPEGVIPDMVVTIQPGEMVFGEPAPLTFPNRLGYAAGFEFDLLSINPVTGEFDDVGDMRVSDDGLRIETISGGILNSSWHMPVQRPDPNVQDQKPPPGCGCPKQPEQRPDNSSVELVSGTYFEDHFLPTYQSLGVPRSLRFVYSTKRVDPTESFSFSADAAGWFDNDASLQTDYVGATLSIGNNDFSHDVPALDFLGITGRDDLHLWSTRDISISSRLSSSIVYNTNSLPDGIYSYSFSVGAVRPDGNGQISGALMPLNGNFIKIGSTGSPFGNGWGIDGLKHILVGSSNVTGTLANAVVIVNGDGSETIFRPQPDGSFFGPPGDFSTFSQLPDGRFQRRFKDGTVELFDSQNRLASVTDRNGNQTSFAYNANSNLIKVTDPVGLETNLTYTPSGKLDFVTLPDGRIIDFNIDANGDLAQITDPESSQRNFAYDAESRMTQETTPRGFKQSVSYDEFGRVRSITGEDGSTTFYSPSELRAAYNPVGRALTVPPPIYGESGQTTLVTPSGNVVTTDLDENGQSSRVSDNFGLRESYERNVFGQVTRLTDWRGAETNYTYDGLGNLTSIVEDVSANLGAFDVTSVPADGLDFPGRIVFPDVAGYNDIAFDQINGDEDKDLIILGLKSEAGSLSTYAVTFPGDGSGGYATPAESSRLFGGSGQAFEVRDLDQNGTQDLAIIHSNSISFFSGNNASDFIFQNTLNDANLANAAEIAIGNVDGTGRSDVLVWTNNSQLLAFSRNADFNLDLPVVTQLPFEPEREPSAKFVDLDGDQLTDFVYSKRNDKKLVVMLANGDGTFSESIVDLTLTPGSIAIADFDSNGSADVAVASAEPSGEPLLQVFDGQGDGSFSPGQTIASQGFGTTLMSAIDLGGDGIIDLVLEPSAFGSHNTLAILRNGGSSFSNPEISNIGINSTFQLVADVNEDGLPDLIRRTEGVQTLLQAPGGDFAKPESVASTTFFSSATVAGDFNGDGFADVAVTANGNASHSKWLGDGNGNLSTLNEFDANITGQLAVADFNQDGRDDLASFQTLQVSLSLSNLDGASQPATTWNTDLEAFVDDAIQTGELNGDGIPDFAVAGWVRVGSNRTGTALDVYLSQPDGSHVPTRHVATSNNIWQPLIGDFDGNGLTDILTIGAGVGNTSQDFGAVMFLGDGSGGFTEQPNVRLNGPNSISGVFVTVDTDGDGHDEFAAADRRTGIFSVFRYAGSSTYNQIHLRRTSGYTPNAITYGDLNGDGWQDIATSDGFNSQNNSLTVFLGNGFTFDPPVSFDAGENLRGLSLADINFDGIQDIVGFSLTNLLLIGGRTKIERKQLTQTFTYDPNFSQLSSYTDEEGRTYTYDIDPANGNVRSVSGPLGYSMSYSYTPEGLLDTETDPLGRVTDYSYDALGRVDQVTFAQGTADEAEVSYTYDAAGNVATFTDENSQVTTFQYDGLNRLILERDPLLHETTYTYDENDNLLTVTDALSRVTTSTYDSNDRLKTVTDPIGNTTTYTYDIGGNLIAVADPLSHTTRHEYDAADRRVRTIDPDGGIVDFRYDRSDNLTSVIDQSRNITRFFFDERERLTREIDPLGKSSFYLYDGVNNLIRSRDRLDRQIEYQYDALDRLVQEDWLDPRNLNLVHSLNFSYDLMDNLLTAGDSQSSLTYTYDALDRVATVDNTGTPGTLPVLLEYQYDDAGNVTQLTDTVNGVAGAVTTYAYDPLHRMSRISQTGNNVADKRVDFGYNAIGQSTSIDRFADLAATQNVASTTYGYDSANRLSNITHKNATDAIFAFYDYGYDQASRITSINDVDGLTTYAYDDRDQLISANRGAADPRGDEQYDYDPSGNRTNSHLHGDSYRITSGNRLVSDGTYNYAYDDEGNLLVRTEIANGATRKFEWDYRNRLVQLTDSDNAGVKKHVVSYVYDTFDRRIAKTIDSTPHDGVHGVATHYVYDREDVVFDILDIDENGATPPALAKRYVQAAGYDNLVSVEDQSGILWASTDLLGSTRFLIDMNGVVQQKLDYDAFGNLLFDINPSVRYLYGGREFDDETNLYFLRARYFDASVGRFVTEDPVGFSGLDYNLFRYVGNETTAAVDPLGLFSLKDAWEWYRDSVTDALAEYGRETIQDGLGAYNDARCGNYFSALGGLLLNSPIGKLGKGIKKLGEKLAPKSKPRPTYTPRDKEGKKLPLPRGKNGEMAPTSEYPHTQIGYRNKQKGGYVQTREFGDNKRPVKQVDWTDHGRPGHTDPHVHDYISNPTGGTPRRGPARPPRPGELGD